MKLAVFSDSHGKTDGMLRAVRESRPDRIIHLGDYARDAFAVERAFPELQHHCVRGNCDFAPDAPDSLLLSLEGKNILITHGHIHGVKSGLSALFAAAGKAGADIVLFGHTHKALQCERDGVRFINPGAAGGFRSPGWAELLINSKEPFVTCTLRVF